MKRTKKKAAPAVEPLKQLPVTGAIIGYARVSTDEQSLNLQFDALNAAGCHRIINEKVSAASSKRYELEKAMELLRPGDVLVIWKLDRLARSIVDLHKKMTQITDAGASLRCLTQPVDTTTASGRLLFNMLGVVAEFERDIGIERIRAGIKSAVARGQRMGAQKKFTDKAAGMQADRDAGLSLADVAKKYRVSRGTVRNYTMSKIMKDASALADDDV